MKRHRSPMKPTSLLSSMETLVHTILSFVGLRPGARRAPALGLVCLAMIASTGEAAPILTVDSAEAGRGEEARVQIGFQPEGNPVAMQFDVRFDAARLAPGYAVAGPAGAAFVVQSASPEAGVARVLVYSASNRPLGSGALVTLPLRVLGTASEGPTPLSISNVVVASASATRLEPVTTQGGVVTVRNASAPVLRRPSLSANGQWVLTLDGQDGRTYSLQVSGDLVGWQTVETRVASGGTAVFVDVSAATGSPRFYRALLMP